MLLKYFYGHYQLKLIQNILKVLKLDISSSFNRHVGLNKYFFFYHFISYIYIEQMWSKEIYDRCKLILTTNKLLIKVICLQILHAWIIFDISLQIILKGQTVYNRILLFCWKKSAIQNKWKSNVVITDKETKNLLRSTFYCDLQMCKPSTRK